MSSRRCDGPCLDLIRDARVMTLASAGGPGGTPWCAPLYYLFDAGIFYFFSSSKARHIEEGLNRTCAASIFRDDHRVENLKGIQMTGDLKRCERAVNAIHIAARYATKYGITCGTENAMAYLSTTFRASLYGFRPNEVWYMDNSTGFGSRESVTL